MTDDDSSYDLQTEPSDLPQSEQRPWLKPLLFFGAALACGLIASVLWLRLHPKPAAPVPTDAAVVTLDPTHRALPAPMAGGATNLPGPGTPAADAPHIVSASPDEGPSVAAEASPDVEAAGPAEVAQEPVATASGSVPDNRDSEPQLLERSQVEYPIDALRVRAEGQVRLKVSIDAQGNVLDVRVAESSGTEALDRAAADAARDWRYKPAMRAGQAAAGSIEVPVDFALEAQQ